MTRPNLVTRNRGFALVTPSSVTKFDPVCVYFRLLENLNTISPSGHLALLVLSSKSQARLIWKAVPNLLFRRKLLHVLGIDTI